MRIRLVLVLLSLIALLSGIDASAAEYAALANIKMPEATLTSANLVVAGPFKVQPKKQAPAQQFVMPSFCRVQGTAKPTTGFELWMPAQDWNGRLLSLGNGVLADPSI